MNGAAKPPAVLRVERSFDAPLQAVFEAWTSPDLMRRWSYAGSDWRTAAADVDLRVGGGLRVVMRTPAGEEHGGGGEYTEISPPERLAFTWAWDDSPDERSLIEVEFGERDGVTTVVLTQSGLPDEDSRRRHAEGWRVTLDNLARAGGLT